MVRNPFRQASSAIKNLKPQSRIIIQTTAPFNFVIVDCTDDKFIVQLYKHNDKMTFDNINPQDVIDRIKLILKVTDNQTVFYTTYGEQYPEVPNNTSFRI